MTASETFLGELRRGLQRCEVADARVLIGVSGGADSVALFLGLIQLCDEHRLSLVVAHFNHRLRGNASDEDADWVRELCLQRKTTVAIGAAETLPGIHGIEEAARNARHEFLDRTAESYGCNVIATAHTANDQVETVLHHIFRGTGLSGLRGIPESRSTPSGRRLVRPMLAIRRELIESYVAEIGCGFRSDETNADTSLTRNWLRHTLMPDLREKFGSQVDSALTRLADQAADLEQTLNLLAGRLLDRIVLDYQMDSVRLDARLLADEPRHLVREAFRLLWQRLNWPRQSMGFVEWNRVAEVAENGGNVNLPGKIRARRHPPGPMLIEKTNR